MNAVQTESLENRNFIHRTIAGMTVLALLVTIFAGVAKAQTPNLDLSAGADAVDSDSMQPEDTLSMAAEDSSQSNPTFSISAESAPRQEDAYTLGAGDEIVIDIFGVPEFSGENGQYTIPIDESLTLPWIGTVSVGGMTLRQASAAIALRYAPFINGPQVSVRLITPRDLRVGVTGAVNRPGSYVINPIAGSTTLVREGGRGTGGDTNKWPTVIDAIETAGGISQVANVRAIEIRRPQRFGPEKVIRVNLLELISNGDLDQDLTLRDGDRVTVPVGEALTPAEALMLATASFSPDTITVNVVGEVVQPGAVEIPPSTSLNQAILAAGGFEKTRARQHKVEMIRLNPDGSVSQRTIPVDFASSLNEENNPTLRQNDIIVVDRSRLTRTSDVLGTILTPIGALLNPLGSIFNILDFFDD
ncbi:MAG: polysaccharide transporter [Cyanothece sp. SIO1E1]|nr:polysaccharide transporter [Cyanothece sp. SIO1E1]